MDLDHYIDLAARRLGGAAILANDEFFAPKEALLLPSAPVWKEGEYTDRGKWMDGWETRRRREPGYDWCIIRLGLPGVLRAVVVDTAFFRGNYPDSCSIDGCTITKVLDLKEVGQADWAELLPQSALKGNTENVFKVSSDRRITHLRLNIFPDGGVARLRAYGIVVPNWEPLRGRGDVDLAAVENGGSVVICSDMFFGHRHNLIMPGAATHMGDGWETKRRRGPGHDWSVIRLGHRGVIRRVELDTTHFKGNAPDSFTLETCESKSAVPEDTTRWTEVMPRTQLQPDTRHTYSIEPTAPATHARLSIFPDGGVGRLRLYGTLA